jgi:hypothetical protein
MTNWLIENDRLLLRETRIKMIFGNKRRKLSGAAARLPSVLFKEGRPNHETRKIGIEVTHRRDREDYQAGNTTLKASTKHCHFSFHLFSPFHL